MKKIMTTLFSSVLALSLVACGTADGNNNDETASGDGNTNDVNNNNDAVEEDYPDELVMGFVPSQDSANIADTIAPLAERLEAELGIPVTGRVMTNYTATVEAMGNNQVQIGFLPPLGYVLATERYDHIEAVLKSIRHGSSTYKAQYTVRADSDIESLEDLEGKIWALADLTSTSGYLFPAAQMMNEFGFESEQDLHSFFGNIMTVGGHDNALITVLEGDADVATTFDDARTSITDDYPEAMEELRVLGYTDEIPNDTISLTTNLPQSLFDRIIEVFLSFNDDEEMLEIMDNVYNWTGIDTATDSDYDIIRSTYEALPQD
ncbi:phosphate/phosphite/phosphonate ABC transporter substrate-binding protein [Evansella sp. AB-P1]|uniref:phosphate/phosphite/phosphonate ABC transporter substrate-binding protein n=1 Tax=Evansella sp. AB-P1 TaxID=3037653 RepID=UPI00241DDD64|nr:phosphate/phosphite/phosphonate ABC transporter substrate-binding protein [Evansella sp. AB-P1]MDG5786819.1 phosphate/phosphite/phosphonate ABC transporter substrate-binding protein [Evansella sp. AB-P1]